MKPKSFLKGGKKEEEKKRRREKPMGLQESISEENKRDKAFPRQARQMNSGKQEQHHRDECTHIDKTTRARMRNQ
jgi:hypothetical protein